MITEKGDKLAMALNPYIGTTKAIRDTCSLIARHATTLARLAVEECNGPWFVQYPTKMDPATYSRKLDAWQTELEANQERISARIVDLVADLPQTDNGPIGVEVDGDPRGWVVRLLVPDTNGVDTYAREVGVA